ncbi:DUF1003 domain-containing protein [Xylocopilactobacillus apis]|uniref:Membrane protein n=1 Tax=Xylocopilactobacillus apis TaxID=2932183 RepID=A0AAU9D4Y5_9LACO|nr:DUF1003 domain-containing protein [Xylocopilactobacillus apis]BDR57551.1 membrane protein [Xylocopilactobacillus apis]
MEKMEVCLVDGSRHQYDRGSYFWNVRSGVQNRIRRDYPKVRNNDFICYEHLLPYQIETIQAMMNADEKQMNKINRKLTRTMEDQDYQVTDVNETLKETQTFGQKIADQVAEVAGSWGFIIFYLVVLFAWISINGLHLFGISFDPYPFILLNLFLSCVAALQAPVIMMSQNRAAYRDRMSSENDYHINLKTEEELRILHAKIDHLMQHQFEHNIEVQTMIFEILSEMRISANEKK